MDKLARYYKILGLPKTASFEEIQKSYFSLMKLYHPDVYHVAGAEEKAKEINEAYFGIINDNLSKSITTNNNRDFEYIDSTIYVNFYIPITNKNKENINNIGKRYFVFKQRQGIISYFVQEKTIHVDYVIFDKPIENITIKELYTAINNSFEK